MMKFVKNRMFRLSGRGMTGFVTGLFIDHLMALFVSIVVVGFLTVILKENAVLPGSIIMIYLFLLLFYNEGWNQGFFYNRASEKKRVFYWLRGFAAGLIASVPGLILAAIILYGFMEIGEVKEGLAVIIYRVLYLPFRFIFEYLSEKPMLHFLPVLVMPAVCGFGYILGLKQFTLRQIFIYEIKRDKPSS